MVRIKHHPGYRYIDTNTYFFVSRAKTGDKIKMSNNQKYEKKPKQVSAKNPSLATEICIFHLRQLYFWLT